MLDKIYNCKICSKKEKRSRGCLKPLKKWVATVNCICDGEEKCDLCKGSGQIKINSCPRALSFSLKRAISYYSYYETTGFTIFPDGKPLINQPVKLLNVFSFITRLKGVLFQRQHQELERNVGPKRKSNL